MENGKTDLGFSADSQILVEWHERYSMGIPKIDEQHKELLRLTNELYASCLKGNDDESKARFKLTIGAMVNYVSEHFSAEERLLQRVNYPGYAEHKREHDSFVKKVLEQVKEFHDGKSFVPNNFVRYLKDWILSHIAMSDKKYSEYIFKLKREGKL
ncbi:MAG: bacteriohemerythrin [Spirochaetaceae bacterium]|jgi:hemerythrin|nr:bacteriohemerythrin [Spirochaetaceae bacterium]